MQVQEYMVNTIIDRMKLSIYKGLECGDKVQIFDKNTKVQLSLFESVNIPFIIYLHRGGLYYFLEFKCLVSKDNVLSDVIRFVKDEDTKGLIREMNVIFKRYFYNIKLTLMRGWE